MMRLKPQLLVADQNVLVRFEREARADPAAAYVQQLGTGFQIVINVPQCEKLYSQSWIAKRIAFVEFLDAMMLHEISHIRYQTYGEKLPMRDGLAHYLDNLLEDNRIEYALVLEYPIFANHIRWLLSALKRDTNITRAAHKEKLERVTKMLQDLFYLVRFGIARKDADPDFISFCLPLVLSSTRGTRNNTLLAAKAIYDYLQEIARQDGADPQTDMGAIASVIQALGDKEAKGVQQAGDQIASSNPLLVLQQAADQDAKLSQGDAVQPLPGSGLEQMESQEGDNSFYRQVVEEKADLIAAIRAVFKRLFEKPHWVRTLEGELNLKMQNELYHASFTGEPIAGYQQLLRRMPSLQLAIFRDVSGSTSSMKEAYAASLVAMLAAVDGVMGIKTAALDFGDMHLVTKAFDESVKEGRIQPRSDGGTNIATALTEAGKFDWFAHHRMGIIVTDGDIYDLASAQGEMDRQTRELGMYYRMVNIGEKDVAVIDYHAKLVRCGVNQLPEVISRMVQEKLGVI